jgi:hypothetical protein
MCLDNHPPNMPFPEKLIRQLLAQLCPLLVEQLSQLYTECTQYLPSLRHSHNNLAHHLQNKRRQP